MKIVKEKTFTTHHNYIVEAKRLSEVIDVSKFIDANYLYAVSHIDEKKVTGDVTSKDITRNQAIVTQSVLDKIIATPDNYADLVKNNRNESQNPVMLMHKDFSDYLTKYGVTNGLQRTLKAPEEKHISDFVNKNPFTQCTDSTFPFSESNYQFMQFVGSADYNKVWQNAKGELLAEPIMLNYIDANLDNENYELDDLVEHLMKRDDVAFITDSYDSKVLRCPLTGQEDGIKDIIETIPGYNATEERTESLNIVYFPKPSDIKKLMDWEVNKNQPEVYNLEHYIVRDILGGKEFLKHPVVDDEPEVPKRKFKRN